MGKHAEWRRIAKRERRRRQRQTLAETRQLKHEAEQKRLEQSPNYQELLQKYAEEEAFQIEEEARLRQEAEEKWLEVEREAQKQWKLLQKRLQEARDERARQNARIRLEWEREQKRLQELKEAKEREKEELERRQKQLQDEIDSFILNGGATPEHLKVTVEVNPGKPLCPFYRKTATCRFRDTCSRNHIKPGVSRILLIPNFYSHYSLEQAETEHGDSSLEFETYETYSHFKEFFFDVLPELERFGRVRQLKVCCNRESHLRGNVYVEYSTTREAVKSFRVFNGRWYGGKQLSVEFCRIDSWKSALCGLHLKRRCPKGSACNFLHVFRSPGNMFYHADRDEHRTPPRRLSEESDRRNWRWSESPERFPQNTVSRNSKGKRRKRSPVRDKRSRHRRNRSSSRRNEW